MAKSTLEPAKGIGADIDIAAPRCYRHMSFIITHIVHLYEQKSEAALHTHAARRGAPTHAMGRRAVAFATDLSKTEEARTLVSQGLDAFARIDVLIYNAALERPRRFTKISETDWDEMLDTNLKGYFFASQALVRHWQANKLRGAIVAIASSAGLIGFPFNADYCASKGGMIALTKAMALDLGPEGIRANVVAPGFIDSAIVKSNRATEAGAKRIGMIEQFIPSRRFAQMSDVANAATFLASDDSAYTNGAVLSVDGGLTLGSLPKV